MKLTFERKCWYALRKYFYYFIIAGIILAVAFGAYGFSSAEESYTTSMTIKVNYTRNSDNTVVSSDNELSMFNMTISGMVSAMSTNIGMDILVEDEKLKTYGYEFDTITKYRERLSVGSSNGNITLQFTSVDAKFNIDVLKIYQEKVFAYLFDLYKSPSGMELTYSVIAEPTETTSVKNSTAKSIASLAVVGFIGGVFVSWLIAAIAIGKTMTLKSKEELHEVTDAVPLATIENGKGYTELITNLEVQTSSAMHILVGTNDAVNTAEIASKLAESKRENAKVLYLDLSDKRKGFAEVVLGEISLADAIVNDTLSAGEKSLIFANYVEEIKKVCVELEKNYNFAIINGENYVNENTRILESLYKQVIVCVNNNTKAKELCVAQNILEDAEVALSGVILQIV